MNSHVGSASRSRGKSAPNSARSNECRCGRVRLEPGQSPALPPRASRERRDEVGPGAFTRSGSREFPDRAFAEPIGQHAEREQMFKAVSAKTKRFRYRANAVHFAAGELPEKVSAAEAERLGRRQRRVDSGGRGVERQAVERRRRKPLPRAAQVGHWGLGARRQPARGLLDQSRSISRHSAEPARRFPAFRSGPEACVVSASHSTNDRRDRNRTRNG